MNERDDGFERRARELLARDAEAVDAATLSRLNRARQRALDELEPASSRRRYLPVLVGATATALVVAIWPYTRTPEVPVVPDSNGDLELLLSQESLELMDELDFYVWVGEEANLG